VEGGRARFLKSVALSLGMSNEPFEAFAPQRIIDNWSMLGLGDLVKAASLRIQPRPRDTLVANLILLRW
jgi:hypothetical protein